MILSYVHDRLLILKLVLLTNSKYIHFRVGIEHTEGDSVAAYSAATFTRTAPAPVPEEPPPTIVENESSDDSD